MNASDSNSPFNDSSYSRERLELETRVLAAALRQSLEIGDTEGSSLAHEQIFLLLKASQEMVIDEPISLPREIQIEKGRQLPDIDWGAAEPELAEGSHSEETGEFEGQHEVHAADNNFAPPAEVGYEGTAVEEPAPEESKPEESNPEESKPEELPEELIAEEPVAEEPTLEAPVAEAPVVNEEAAVAFKGDDYYAELKVTDLADFASIHLAFWRMLRVMLRREVGLVGPERLPHLRAIQRLWIAHDILCDPVTRADYDFRRMGLRGDDVEDELARASKGTRGPRTQLRIGELLQCAGLLEQTELDIAADMHKAMPEMMFGTFLVKQGFIEEADLDCVLVGQQLLKTGDITVVQFQTVMIERSATGLDIGEMLLAKGYVTEFLLERAYRNQSEDTLVKVPVVVAPGHVTTIEAKPHHDHAQHVEPEAAASHSSPQAPPATAPDPSPAPAPAPVAEETPRPRENQPPGRRTLGSLVPPSVTRQNLQAQPPLSPLVDDLGPLVEEPVSASLVEQLEAANATAADTNVPVETTISIGNAAPAWKDQLDWSSPEEDVEPVSEHVTESKPEYAESLATSELSAPDIVAPEPLAEEEETPDKLADSVRAIAQIWAEEPDPVRSWALGSELETEQAAEFLLQPEVELELAPEPELVSEPAPEPAPAPEQGEIPEPVSPVSQVSRAVLEAQDNVVSEIETSSQLPSLGTLEAQASGKKKDREPKRGTGDWQIMSVPASALTSLFLDDEPEAPPAPSNAFINEDQYQTGPRTAYVPEPEAEVSAQPPAEQEHEQEQQQDSQSQVQTIPPASNLPEPGAKPANLSSSSSSNKEGESTPSDNESRRTKRRRTRS